MSFGMSFAQDTPGGATESLYIADSSGLNQTRFGRVNLMNYTLSPTIAINGQNPELTGDDDGNLWGFFPSEVPPFIARINKMTGALDRRIQLAALVGQPTAWGVAHYRGDFYVFLQRSFDASTNIYRVNGMSGMITTVASNTGRRIVGVGVATCAGDPLDMGPP